MLEGLFQPMHLLVIFGIALLVFGRRSFRNWARESQKASEALSQL
jgi:Sec-independent protein translocase protein TatA